MEDAKMGMTRKEAYDRLTVALGAVSEVCALAARKDLPLEQDELDFLYEARSALQLIQYKLVRRW